MAGHEHRPPQWDAIIDDDLETAGEVLLMVQLPRRNVRDEGTTTQLAWAEVELASEQQSGRVSVLRTPTVKQHASCAARSGRRQSAFDFQNDGDVWLGGPRQTDMVHEVTMTHIPTDAVDKVRIEIRELLCASLCGTAVNLLTLSRYEEVHTPS